MNTMNYLRWLALSLAVQAFALNATCEDLSSTINMITQAEKHRESYLRNYDIVVVIETDIKPLGAELGKGLPEYAKAMAAQDSKTTSRYEAKQWNGKKYLKALLNIQFGDGSAAKETGVESAYNGTLTQVRYLGAVNGIIQESDAMFSVGEWVVLENLLSAKMSVNPGMYLDEYVDTQLDKGSLSLSKDAEGHIVLEGRDPSTGLAHRLVFAPEMDYALIEKRTISNSKTPVSRSRKTYQKTPEGNWFPASSETNTYNLRTGEVQIRRRLSVERMSFEQPPDSVFDIKFPAGTQVTDKRSSLLLIAQENGRLFPFEAGPDPSGQETYFADAAADATDLFSSRTQSAGVNPPLQIERFRKPDETMKPRPPQAGADGDTKGGPSFRIIGLVSAVLAVFVLILLRRRKV